jgi:peptide/nickel transport system substrate-binding protein
MQIEPAALDVRVRAALYSAVDREAISEALQGGHRELAAYEIMPPDHPMFPATKDSLRRYGYDPQRARAMLTDAGWTLGADGRLRNNQDGRTFRAPVWGTAGRDREQETAAIADYWRRIGLETEEVMIPAARVRDGEYRSSFPGWEVSSGGEGDQLLQQLEGPAAGPENRWSGNRRGYEDPRTDELIKAYRSSLTTDQQLRAIQALSDVVVQQLPFLMLYYTAYHIGASSRVDALKDYDGAGAYSADYGTFSRNGHLWSLK